MMLNISLRYKSAIGNTLRKEVADATFERAKSRLGTKGVVDMTGIVGYYTFLAMQLNVAQYPAAGLSSLQIWSVEGSGRSGRN